MNDANKWEYRRGYRKLFGDGMLPDIQRALDNLVAKHLITGPPTEDLQRVFDDALSATTDYVMGPN